MGKVASLAARRKSTGAGLLDGPATGTRRRALDADPAPLLLIVDDNDDARDLYGDFLLSSGFRVALAVDGDHALWKVVTLKPALVVMDLAMPVIDGWEATNKIKTHPKTKHIPVIALTGHISAESLQRAADAGADTVLTKPCLPSTLLGFVRRLLHQ